MLIGAPDAHRSIRLKPLVLRDFVYIVCIACMCEVSPDYFGDTAGPFTPCCSCYCIVYLSRCVYLLVITYKCPLLFKSVIKPYVIVL